MPRSRSIPLQFFVNEDEKKMINDHMEMVNCPSQSDYLRQMALHGIIIHTDTSDIKDLTQAINRIGANINQIVRRANETHEVYQADIESVQESLEKVWQLQRSILLKQL